MKTKWFILTAATVSAVIVLLALGAVAFAQEPDPTTTPTYPGWGPGWMMSGRGPAWGDFFGMMRNGLHPMMWGGWHGRMMGGHFGYDRSLVAVSAQMLGLSVSDLLTELSNGKTIAEVANAKGLSTDKIVDEFLKPRVEWLQSAVKANRFTQAQADAMIAALKANVNARLSTPFTANPYGLGFGGWMDANGNGVCDWMEQ